MRARLFVFGEMLAVACRLGSFPIGAAALVLRACTGRRLLLSSAHHRLIALMLAAAGHQSSPSADPLPSNFGRGQYRPPLADRLVRAVAFSGSLAAANCSDALQVGAAALTPQV